MQGCGGFSKEESKHLIFGVAKFGQNTANLACKQPQFSFEWKLSRQQLHIPMTKAQI